MTIVRPVTKEAASEHNQSTAAANCYEKMEGLHMSYDQGR